jgi:hypothetical protein
MAYPHRSGGRWHERLWRDDTSGTHRGDLFHADMDVFGFVKGTHFLSTYYLVSLPQIGWVVHMSHDLPMICSTPDLDFK